MVAGLSADFWRFASGCSASGSGRRRFRIDGFASKLWTACQYNAASGLTKGGWRAAKGAKGVAAVVPAKNSEIVLDEGFMILLWDFSIDFHLLRSIAVDLVALILGVALPLHRDDGLGGLSMVRSRDAVCLDRIRLRHCENRRRESWLWLSVGIVAMPGRFGRFVLSMSRGTTGVVGSPVEGGIVATREVRRSLVLVELQNLFSSSVARPGVLGNLFIQEQTQRQATVLGK